MTDHRQSLEDWIFKCVGGLSVLVCISSMIPQIYKMYKTKRTNDLSITSYYINFCGVTLIEIYAFYFNLWEIFIPNVLSWLLIVLQILLKKCYDVKYGILDEQLAKNILESNGNVEVISPIGNSPSDSNMNLDNASLEHSYNNDEYQSFRVQSDEIINPPLERL